MNEKTVNALGYEWTIAPETFVSKRARYILMNQFDQLIEKTPGKLEKAALVSVSTLYYNILSVTKKLVDLESGEDCRGLLDSWVEEPQTWIDFLGIVSEEELTQLYDKVVGLNPHWYPDETAQEAEGVAEAVEQAVEGKGDAMAAAKAVGELQDKREEEAEKNG